MVYMNQIILFDDNNEIRWRAFDKLTELVETYISKEEMPWYYKSFEFGEKNQDLKKKYSTNINAYKKEYYKLYNEYKEDLINFDKWYKKELNDLAKEEKQIEENNQKDLKENADYYHDRESELNCLASKGNDDEILNKVKESVYNLLYSRKLLEKFCEIIRKLQNKSRNERIIDKRLCNIFSSDIKTIGRSPAVKMHSSEMRNDYLRIKKIIKYLKGLVNKYNTQDISPYIEISSLFDLRLTDCKLLLSRSAHSGVVEIIHDYIRKKYGLSEGTDIRKYVRLNPKHKSFRDIIAKALIKKSK